MHRKSSVFRPAVAGICFAGLLVSPAQARSGSSDRAVRDLHALFDAEWERGLREYPEHASYTGDERFNDRWTDLSREAVERRHRADRGVLDRIDRIDRDRLSAAEQLNYDLFRGQYAVRVDGHRFREFLMPLDHQGGVQTADQIQEVLPFQRVKDFEDWIARMRGMRTLLGQTTALLEEGVREGRTGPRVIMERIPRQIALQVVDEPEESPFYAPFNQMPDGLGKAEQRRLRAEARRTVAEVVVPAYRRFGEFLTERYLPAARTSVGAADLPDGRAYYAHLARSHTTTDMSPDQIHELGLAEVARIGKEMLAVIDEVGFEGSYAEFAEFLRTDRRFYYDTAEELVAGYRAIKDRIDPELGTLFGRLPRLPYRIEEVPAASAPDTTTAYYQPGNPETGRPGTFYVNTYKPEARPRYEMEALTAHEGAPGHHLQIALAQEHGDLPLFRRYGLSFTAFTEGWGLYSESLGAELGLYRDPYSHFGQLTYEMWRAARLVVDTGLHAQGWSRDRAIGFFSEHVARSELDIVNEVDRYIAWPGQALAYKIGELKIKALRARAAERLGSRFDIRAFHDVVLGSGELPLDLLEATVDRWIAGGG